MKTKSGVAAIECLEVNPLVVVLCHRFEYMKRGNPLLNSGAVSFPTQRGGFVPPHHILSEATGRPGVSLPRRVNFSFCCDGEGLIPLSVVFHRPPNGYVFIFSLHHLKPANSIVVPNRFTTPLPSNSYLFRTCLSCSDAVFKLILTASSLLCLIVWYPMTGCYISVDFGATWACRST